MTQQMFLDELRARLRRRIPEERVQEILNDYREYFSDGLAEGRDENTLCRAFGTPAEIVSELQSEGRFGSYGHQHLFDLIVWGSFLLLAYLTLFPISWSILEAPRFLHYGLLFVPLIQITLLGTGHARSSLLSEKRRLAVMAGCTIVPVLILAGLIHVLLRVAGGESGWLPFGPASLGPAIHRLLGLGMLIVLAAWWLSISWGGRRAFWIILLYAGLFSTMQEIGEMLHWLDEPEAIAGMILESCIPLLVSAALSATLGLLFSTAGKGLLDADISRQAVFNLIGWGSFPLLACLICLPLIRRDWWIPSVLCYGIPFLPLLQWFCVKKGRGRSVRQPPWKKSAIMLAGCIAFPILTLIVSSCIPLWFTRKGDGWIPHGSVSILAPLVTGLVVAGMLIALVGWECSFLWGREGVDWLAFLDAGLFAALYELSKFLYYLDDPEKMHGALLACCNPLWWGIALAGYALLRQKGWKDD